MSAYVYTHHSQSGNLFQCFGQTSTSHCSAATLVNTRVVTNRAPGPAALIRLSSRHLQHHVCILT